MGGYIDVPGLSEDAAVIAADALDYLVANLDGFDPEENDLVVWLVETLSRVAAERGNTWRSVARAIFRFYGLSILQLPPVDGAFATAPSTWVMVDNAGYTIPAGTVVAYRTAGDTLVPFTVLAAVTVPPGATSTIASQVVLRAEVLGDEANGLPIGAVELIDSLAFVASIASTGVTAGGVDAETDDDYLDRLVEEVRLSSPRPILPGDFAVLARRVPGVRRAVAIDGYNPADLTTNNERMVAMAALDINGVDVGVTIRTAMQTYLDSLRELNFVVASMAATTTTVAVTATAKAVAGADKPTVKAAAELALTSYLSGKTWAGGTETPPVWRDERIVRYLEVAQVINAVPGVDYITTTGGLFDLLVDAARLDVTLAGPAAIPTPGTMTVTVT